MKKFLSAMIFITYSQLLFAGSANHLYLKGRTLKTNNSRIISSEILPDRTQLLFSSQSNSKYPDEEPKLEIIGSVEVKQLVKINKIKSSNNTSFYQITINSDVKTEARNSSIILKISSN